MTHHFISSDTGAVTVDWVVLTAALVGLGLATMAVVSSGVEDVSGDVKTQLKSDDIISTSFPSRAFEPANGILAAGKVSWVSNDLINTWIADRSSDAYTDQQILDAYETEIGKLNAAYDANNVAQIEGSLDWIGIYEQAMVNREMPDPEASTNYATERARYDAL